MQIYLRLTFLLIRSVVVFVIVTPLPNDLVEDVVEPGVYSYIGLTTSNILFPTVLPAFLILFPACSVTFPTEFPALTTFDNTLSSLVLVASLVILYALFITSSLYL